MDAGGCMADLDAIASLWNFFSLSLSGNLSRRSRELIMGQLLRPTQTVLILSQEDTMHHVRHRLLTVSSIVLDYLPISTIVSIITDYRNEGRYHEHFPNLYDVIWP